MPLPPHIQDERNQINQLGTALGTEKEEALDNFTPITTGFMIGLLELYLARS